MVWATEEERWRGLGRRTEGLASERELEGGLGEQREAWGGGTSAGDVSPEQSELWTSTRSPFTLSWTVLKRALV